MVTCVVHLPFVSASLLHFTFHFRMSRRCDRSTQPHHAHALLMRAVPPCVRAIRSLLFSSPGRAQALSRKLLSTRATRFRETKRPHPLRHEARTSWLGHHRARFILAFFWLGTHAVTSTTQPAPRQHAAIPITEIESGQRCVPRVESPAIHSGAAAPAMASSWWSSTSKQPRLLHPSAL